MILHGDSLEAMCKMESNSISAIVTDPPYGLHFMGKDWDKFKKTNYNEKSNHKIVKSTGEKNPERLRGIRSIYSANSHAGSYDEKRNDEFQEFICGFSMEALRIVKPGGYILMFGAPRRFHRQICGLEDAGWEIRDCLSWLFGSGFPKSHNHFGIEGYGTALKPAWEPIIMAMKPCDGTFKQNAEKWGQAGINIDESRVGKRWPANLILDEEAAQMLDEQSEILKSGAGIKNPIGMTTKGFMSSNWRDSGHIEADSGGASRFFYCAKASSSERNEGLDCYLTVKYSVDKTGHLWQEESMAAVELLRKVMFELIQHLNIDVSGGNIMAQFHRDFSSIIKMKIKQIIESKTLNWLMLLLTKEFILDANSLKENGGNLAVDVMHLREWILTITDGKMELAHGASNAALTMLSLISEEENWKEKTCSHPTVKPLKLMEYLIKLVMPPTNGLLLDPFAGSGTTLLAAKRLGFEAIGIEKEEEYCEIAKARIANFEKNRIIKKNQQNEPKMA